MQVTIPAHTARRMMRLTRNTAVVAGRASRDPRSPVTETDVIAYWQDVRDVAEALEDRDAYAEATFEIRQLRDGR